MSDLALALTSTGAIPPGTRLGKYEVLKRLRSGGMAEIYVARAHGAAGVTQLAVIKRILPHLAEDPDFIRMFLNEAKITASLDHPNIAHVKEVGRAGGEYFLALEYIHGVDLQRILRQSAAGKGIPLGAALAIIAAVAQALHYAHERSIVHRDMTPSNVMVTYEGHTKVLDFGIAKALRTALTRTGTIKGKVGYMSPEQCVAEDVDRRSDVFALGILLYEITVGKRLFKGDSDFAVMNQIMLGRIVAPREHDPSYPEPLERIILEAIALDPDARFQTAHALGRAIDDYAHTHGLRTSPTEVAACMRSLFGEAPAPVTPAELQAIPETPTVRVVQTRWTLPGAGSARTRPIVIGIAGTALGIAVGVGAMGMLQSQRGPAPGTANTEPDAASVSSPRHSDDAAQPTVDEDKPGTTTSDAVEVVIEAEPIASPAPEEVAKKRRTRPKKKARPEKDPGSNLFPPSRGGG